MSFKNKIIQELADELENYLISKGFSRVQSYWDESVREWQRSADWKMDRVNMSLKWDKHVYVSFLVLFPQDKNESKNPYLIFDQIQSGKICNERWQRYEIPSLEIMSRGFVEKVVTKVDSAITWFDKYNNIDSCIQYLLEKYGNPPDSEGGRRKLEYLNKIKLMLRKPI